MDDKKKDMAEISEDSLFEDSAKGEVKPPPKETFAAPLNEGNKE